MMSTDYWKYRPSRKPSVKQVDTWQEIYSEYNHTHWRGEAFAGEVWVYRGYPFPDFYKVTFCAKGEAKAGRPKYFYGESAHHEVERYVSDMGFDSIYGRV